MRWKKKHSTKDAISTTVADVVDDDDDDVAAATVQCRQPGECGMRQA